MLIIYPQLFLTFKFYPRMSLAHPWFTVQMWHTPLLGKFEAFELWMQQHPAWFSSFVVP